jgi:hypothetical protein
MTNVKNTTQNNTAKNAAGACGSCSCGCPENACHCAESNCQCGCQTSGGK